MVNRCPGVGLDERCFAVEKVGEELHALRAHNLARVLVNERIGTITEDTSFRNLHIVELFAPIDFTGNLHSVAMEPTSSLIAMCSSQSASALSAGLFEAIPVPKPAMPLMG